MDSKMRNVFVDRENRWGLDIDEITGRMFVNIPVANRMADYLEWYEIDKETFERFRADPSSAMEFVKKAKNRELDHLLLLKPGTDRGWPS
jgi:hypothetical protein